MMQETRVNLRHLLEDIRDGYASPIEEVIITELVANALDSRASRIEFLTDIPKGQFTICDNGQGMKRQAVKNYHNIAATTKIRGRGIGFAGIGAKLSLLIAKSVITETKGGYGSHCATQWYLTPENRAPWKFVPSPGRVAGSRGTAVTIELLNPELLLLSSVFISETIKKHFYPFLRQHFIDSILKHIYKKGVEFFINGEKIWLESETDEFSKTFTVSFGKTKRELAGFGYLAKSSKETSNSEFSGIGVSTYGKVIKRGWEWLGIMPKSNLQMCGMVEIPAFSEILTTNKNDFLKDPNSLKKYYKYRKAIQEAVLPILFELGEEGLSLESDLKRLRPLEKEIEKTLGHILPDFPELTPLVGVVKKTRFASATVGEEIPTVNIASRVGEEEHYLAEEDKLLKEKSEKSDKPKNEVKKKESPGLTIAFEKDSSRLDLARIVKNIIWVNMAHPAYGKSQSEDLEEYHILLCVAWALSGFIGEGHSPQDFISQFLASWGSSSGKAKENLQILKV